MNLNQVTVKSKDVNRSTEFYQKLGLRLIVDSRPRYVRFECPVGDSTFSISYSQKTQDFSTVMYFEVDNIDISYKKLKASGIVFNSAPKDKRWLWRESALNDPDGHPLILYTAGKNRKNPPWRVHINPAT
jgi:catechol 2,3-dioxygenase-like lactoylglutathione lyase family enzyme